MAHDPPICVEENERLSLVTRPMISGAVVAAISGSLASIYILVAGALFSYQRTASGVAASFAALVATIYSVYVVAQFVHPRRTFSAANLLIPIALISVATGFIPFSFADLFTAQPERYHLERSNITATPLRYPGLSPWIAVHEIPNLYASSIHMLIWFQVENEQQRDSFIEAYSFATSHHADGPWKELCPVNMAGSKFYWALNRTQADEFATVNFLDNILLNKPLLPFQPIAGWTAWQCLGDCTGQFGKFTVRDTSGRRVSAVFNLKNSQDREAGAGDPMYAIRGSRRDLSMAKEGLEPDCSE